ncbi:MAG: glutathione S-transferase N-terminal domain-containing protein [Pseudomonadota bacterium]
MADYRLIGTEMSYYSGKVRAYLRWKGIDFEEVVPTPPVMMGEVMANIGWPVIPVLQAPDGHYIQDSYDIIQHFEEVDIGASAYPSSPLQHVVSLLIQLYADEWLVIPAMHYRWNHNEEWVYGEFGVNASPDGTADEQYAAGKSVGAHFKGALPFLGITDETVAGVEAAYEATLHDLSVHLEQFPYMLGSRASFADFCMMGPLYAHLYRDPASGALMKRIAPKVADYVERTMAGEGRQGDLLAGDAIPETLLPILKRQMSEQLPVLLASIPLLEVWAQTAEPGAEVPRGFVPVPFETGGHAGMCMARSFPLFRLQNALGMLGSALSNQEHATKSLLHKAGGEALLDGPLKARLTRRNHKLCLA